MVARLNRLAMELRLQRRRLDAYRSAPPWPGKDSAWASEAGRYDRSLLLAAELLEVAVPAPEAGPTLAPADRAALEDRLAIAGFDVFAPARFTTGDVLTDGDLCL